MLWVINVILWYANSQLIFIPLAAILPIPQLGGTGKQNHGAKRESGLSDKWCLKSGQSEYSKSLVYG